LRPQYRTTPTTELANLKTSFFGKTLSGPFTIPSGIVTTATPIIQYVFDHMPEVGVVTTKSIGLEPRAGYREPVLSQYAPGCFVNAVGLTNPGARESLALLGQLRVPEDRFLLTSIFGGSVEEFVEVAKILAPVSDGLELNLSCPHAKGYGMAMGQDPDLVREITAAVGEIARAAVDGGADGLCAINTVGPGYTSAHGHPVLSNGSGGISGKGVLPIGLKCVREVAREVDCPIIGCGGVSSAEDVQAYFDAGATIVGVGSSLVGLTTEEIGDYFLALAADLGTGNNRAESQIRYDIDMHFRPVTLVEQKRVCEDITEAYVRGPHGIPVDPPEDAKIMAVAGGTGLAAVYQVARDFGNAEVFAGARSAERLYFLEECKQVAEVHVATDDGSAGFQGVVTELLRERLQQMSQEERDSLVFYNCGPEPMVHAAVAVQREFCRDQQIFSAIDYLTKCGVGICGGMID
jgi:dihydroorotate dehydrogenase (NAD+) catalytic subunit